MFAKEKKEIRFRAIMEIMGRPAEFLTETLNKTIDTLEKEEKMKVLNKQIYEPKELEERKDLFTLFAEVEVSAVGLDSLFGFIVKYAPSNIEIIDTSEIRLPVNEVNMILNGFVEKVHKMEYLDKALRMENAMLKNKLGSMTPEEIKQLDLQKDEMLRKQIESEQKAKKGTPKKKSKK